MIPIISLATLFALASAQSGQSVRCTYHDYEAMSRDYGLPLDNAPGWCGSRYSVLNVARVTAVNGLDTSLCNQCLEVAGTNGGPVLYVLAVDKKGDPGLDIAKSSFQALFPSSNPLDPQLCNWKVVEPSKCGTICYGTAEECTPGVRNLIPAYLMPPSVQAPHGLAGSSSEPYMPPAPAPLQSQPQSDVSSDDTVTISVNYESQSPMATDVLAITSEKPLLESSSLIVILASQVPITSFVSPAIQTLDPQTISSESLIESGPTSIAAVVQTQTATYATIYEPVITTTDPVITTTEPVITTTEPVITTTEPVITTTEPVITTTEPVITTTEPVITTTEPVITTTEPIITIYSVTVTTDTPMATNSTTVIISEQTYAPIFGSAQFPTYGSGSLPDIISSATQAHYCLWNLLLLL